MSALGLDFASWRSLPDAGSFLDRLHQVHADWFEEELAVARAPGRLDVMGGIADYSGSLVLEMPIREAAFVAVHRRMDARVDIESPCRDGSRDARVEIDLAWLAGERSPELPELSRTLCADLRRRWAAYVVGAFAVLARERGIRFQHGASLWIDSRVPEGKGVSSSAALEVAAMCAIAGSYRIDLEREELARLCQRVENQVAGAPCGIMDQMTVACGRASELLELSCQPHTIEGYARIPDSLAVFGLDCGVRHTVGGDRYRRTRVAAFMGQRILAELRGLEVRCADGRAAIVDPEWNGALARCPIERWRNEFRAAVPETLSGAEFLRRFRGITDPVTRIAPSAEYPVRAATQFPIEENARARTFRKLLRESGSGAELGDLMFASHQGYVDCGMSCAETDWIVDQARADRDRGGPLLGARVTGGGCGGTVAILAERHAGSTAVATLGQRYRARFPRIPYRFAGSSPAAAYSVASAARGGLQLDLK